MSNNKEYYDVLITTPGRNMDRRYVLSLLATIKELDSLGITWSYSNQSSSDVSIAREATILGSCRIMGWASNFSAPINGNIDYKKIFLIDSDIFWKPEDFLKLYYSEEDAISGVYLQDDQETTTLLTPLKENDGAFSMFTERMRTLLRSEIVNKSAKFEISGCGLGFVCLKKGIFESVERPWFQHLTTSGEVINGEKIVELVSEDISFIKRCREKGFKFYADPTVLVGHVKNCVIDW
jgi:hypothetical protein